MKTRFDSFLLDDESRQLTAGSRSIHLPPKAFDLLVALLAERPGVISKARLQERLWPGCFVVEANLSNTVSELRQALGDSARAPRFIRTVHGLGYAFCGAAAAVESERNGELEPLVCWIEWGRQRFPLFAGEHVIGRDRDVEIRLDASTVSRRHAKLSVSSERTTLEDSGSKNGTFLGEHRVTSPVRLTDGDAVRIGSLLLTFRVHSGSMSTDTQDQSIQ